VRRFARRDYDAGRLEPVPVDDDRRSILPVSRHHHGPGIIRDDRRPAGHPDAGTSFYHPSPHLTYDHYHAAETF